MDLEYLYYQLQHLKNNWLNKTQENTQKNLNSEIAKKFLIPFPILSEQQKIASILSNVDDLIQKTDQVIEQTQRLKKGLMQRLLTKGIRHAKFKKTKYGEVSENWNLSLLENVCKISVGIATSTTKYFVDNGIPLLRNQNIKEGYIDINDLVYISNDFARINSSKKLKAGDVICVRTGYPGLSAVVPPAMNGWQTFTTLILRPITEIIDSHYLCYFINAIGRKQVNSFQAGGAQQNLNVGWISKLEVTLPSIIEQQKIVSILSNVDNLIQNLQEKKKKEEMLKKGLMQQLLTGKIRVKV